MRYERQGDDGMQTKVTESYVVDALSFGEAEDKITEEMSTFVSGEFEVKNITPASYGEIFFSDMADDDKWYKAKLTFITIDEEKGKEKKSSVNYLVQAKSVNGAVKNIDEVFAGSVMDYMISTISESKIMDVYEHRQPNKGTKKDDEAPEFLKDGQQ